MSAMFTQEEKHSEEEEWALPLPINIYDDEEHDMITAGTSGSNEKVLSEFEGIGTSSSYTTKPIVNNDEAEKKLLEKYQQRLAKKHEKEDKLQRRNKRLQQRFFGNNKNHLENGNDDLSAPDDNNHDRNADRSDGFGNIDPTKFNIFPGKHKWLGGAVDPDTGIIYGIPSHSHEVLAVIPPQLQKEGALHDESVSQDLPQAQVTRIKVPYQYMEGSFKWLRGIIANGYLYGIPAWSVHGVLKVRLLGSNGTKLPTADCSDKSNGHRVQILPLPKSTQYYRDDDDKNNGNNRTDCISGGDPDTSPTVTPTVKQEHFTKLGRNGQYYHSVDRGRWMWHGGALGTTCAIPPPISSSPSSTSSEHEHHHNQQEQQQHARQSIYCIPSNASQVLKIDISTDEVTEIGPSFYSGQNKWYGGIVGVDGCIYGMPYTAKGVIRINPLTDSVQVLGDYPTDTYKWHGGLLARSTGVIYAFPAHSNEVLCVNTNPRPSMSDNISKASSVSASEVDGDSNDDIWRISTIPIQRHDDDSDQHGLQYKWLGGAYGADGCIYGMPSDATSILRIDPIKNEATTFGKVSSTKNKWQGGVLSSIDNCVYAVPADMNNILRIHTDANDKSKYLSFETIGDIEPDVEDKWQGGFVARDGCVYGIPENIDRIMKLTPGTKPTLEYLQ